LISERISDGVSILLHADDLDPDRVACFFGAILFFCGARSLSRRRVSAGMMQGLVGLLLGAAAGLMMAVLVNLHSYHRLTYEAPVAEVRFQKRANQHFRAYVTFGRADAMICDVGGDEWQMDARVLKWKGSALLLGSDTLYRLDRLSGRYRDIAQERTQQRSVYSLAAKGMGLDIWPLLQRYSKWVPWVDAVYGMPRTCPWPTGRALSFPSEPADWSPGRQQRR